MKLVPLPDRVDDQIVHPAIPRELFAHILHAQHRGKTEMAWQFLVQKYLIERVHAREMMAAHAHRSAFAEKDARDTFLFGIVNKQLARLA